MIKARLSSFSGKRVLLLQGPLGPFFWRLKQDLSRAGAEVFKVNFNGGDWLFYRKDAINFHDGINEWPVFLEELVRVHHIDTIMLFGDCRVYHTAAYNVARRLGLEVGVFEEGYIRPDYITLEREGVNGYSPLPTNPIFYLNNVPAKPVRTDPVGNTFWYAAAWACLYYLAAILLRPLFPKYRHHRALGLLEGGRWVRSAWRKWFYRLKERGIEARLVGDLSKKYFLVPLQVHNDAQIHVHSDFDSVEAFVRHVVLSFAQHAPADTTLVIKHHPMDRGYSDYSALLERLKEESGLGSRLMYVHDQHLPSLLDHARGVVVVNSTVGLSALFHKAPLKVCGNSIYGMQGLTYQGELDGFWRDAESMSVDMTLFHRFRSYLIEHTQLNGSFYKRLSIPGSFSGVRWEERWLSGDPDRRRANRSPNDAATAAIVSLSKEQTKENKARRNA